MATVLIEGSGFREGIVELPGRSVHCVQAGTGRSIVLIHGFTDSWYSYRLVLPLLNACGRCVAYDQRGHGATSYSGSEFGMGAFAGDAVDLINRLDLGPVTLVGHSMGGLVARKVAVEHPELVRRLVLVGSPYQIETPAVRELAGEVARLGSAVPRSFVESFQASCVADRGMVPDWFFKTCVDASAAVAPAVWKAVMAGMLANDPLDRLGTIQCPALVIGGREDQVFTAADQTRLAAALPRAELLLYDGVGHSPHWERPARFAADVAAFLG